MDARHGHSADPIDALVVDGITPANPDLATEAVSDEVALGDQAMDLLL